ncbi:MAG: ArsA family ATPase, partial [Actinomycetota bacterium]
PWVARHWSNHGWSTSSGSRRFAIGDIKAHATSGEYDLLIVDCAPTAETIRLLSLPDVIGWYMERVFETQRRLTRLARPLVQRVAGVPVAGDPVFGALRRLYDRLDGVRDVLTDGEVTSARLVVNAERLVVAEARRTYTYLSLFGYHVDAVIANRLLPEDVDHPWFDQWRATQGEHLAHIREVFAPLPVLTAELAPEEIVGTEALAAFAKRCYGDEHRGPLGPAARLCAVEPFRVEPDPTGDGVRLVLHLPGVGPGEVGLARTPEELVVTVGPHRRAIVLPDSLIRREVRGARFDAGRLVVELV